jgi:hypothetical protein
LEREKEKGEGGGRGLLIGAEGIRMRKEIDVIEEGGGDHTASVSTREFRTGEDDDEVA